MWIKLLNIIHYINQIFQQKKYNSSFFFLVLLKRYVIIFEINTNSLAESLIKLNIYRLTDAMSQSVKWFIQLLMILEIH